MKLSVVILTKNEERMIKECLDSVKWAEEIIVVDSGSSDRTLDIARRYTNQIITEESDNFSAKRNLGLEKAKSEWILYVDADERVSRELEQEIKSEIIKNESEMAAYWIPRKNFYFGNHEWPYLEKIERLFKKDKLDGWKGKIHESPVVRGPLGELNNYLLHCAHRDLSSMVEKTIEWSKVEAELRLGADHPPVSWWRFPRVMLTEFYRSYIKQGGWRAGTVGVVESFYQAFSIFVTYARLWEMQNKLKIKNKQSLFSRELENEK